MDYRFEGLRQICEICEICGKILSTIFSPADLANPADLAQSNFIPEILFKIFAHFLRLLQKLCGKEHEKLKKDLKTFYGK